MYVRSEYNKCQSPKSTVVNVHITTGATRGEYARKEQLRSRVFAERASLAPSRIFSLFTVYLDLPKVRVAQQLMGRWGKSDKDAASAFLEIDSAIGEEGELSCTGRTRLGQQ